MIKKKKEETFFPENYKPRKWVKVTEEERVAIWEWDDDWERWREVRGGSSFSFFLFIFPCFSFLPLAVFVCLSLILLFRWAFDCFRNGYSTQQFKTLISAGCYFNWLKTTVNLNAIIYYFALKLLLCLLTMLYYAAAAVLITHRSKCLYTLLNSLL